MRFRGEIDCSYCRGEGAVVTQKGRREISTQEDEEGEHFLKPLARKVRRADFSEFLQSAKLKDWSLKGKWA